jgi:succinyl-CoA synthetase alpha subunit
VPGTSFIDCLSAFEADPDTKAVMMIGETFAANTRLEHVDDQLRHVARHGELESPAF